MSDRYMNAEACGIEPEREGGEPTLEQWRARCRQLWAVRRSEVEMMRMLLKLVCLGDTTAATDLDNRLEKLL